MKLPTLFLLTGLATVASLRAEPRVIGYERFHAGASTAAGGAILYSELGCANCHGGSAVVVPRKGPNLADLSKRADHNWVAGFLEHPSSGRAGSTMPSLLHSIPKEKRDQAVKDILAWLGTLNGKLKFKVARHANAERGSALYHEKGCVACHAPTPDFKSPHHDPRAQPWKLAIAHPDLSKKTTLVALSHFLANPSLFRTDGRMPHLELDEQEAIDIAAHLLDFQSSDPRESPPLAVWPAASAAAAKNGKAWAEQLNCAACHELPGLATRPLKPLSAPPASETGNCLSAQPVGGRPHYDLADGQRASLIAFLKSDQPETDTDGKLTLAAMNCLACHDRDGIGGPPPETNPFFIGDEGLGDSGRLPPPLTGIGFKLKRDWLKSVFTSGGAGRVRDYVKTRMPAYPAHAGVLSDWLATIDAKPDAVPLAEVTADRLEFGRKLIGTQGGLNCIICHRWDGHASLGIQAMDISALNERLRPEWFRSYLLNPAAYRPATLMPPLWPGGKSVLPDVLGGDTESQIAAIWSFIQDGKGVPEGYPDRVGGKFELVPEDRPIIQRAFVDGVGTSGILVGFPKGINLAYDGASASPALLWRGRFFDAYNTWFSRFPPFEKPLEEKVHSFSKTKSEARFLGYEIDKAGNPVFLSRRGEQKIEEHFAASDGTLVRTIRWSDGGTAPEPMHPEGVEVAMKSGKGTLTITYSWK